MAKKDRAVRVAGKAVVVRRGRLLLVRKKSETDEWYSLPGGGQEKFETIGRALVRECREETGYTVKMGPLMFVSEYIGKNHEFAKVEGDAHQIDLFFLCGLAKGRRRSNLRPDEYQCGIEWVPLSRLSKTRLYPKFLRRRIPAYLKRPRPPYYLGDIN